MSLELDHLRYVQDQAYRREIHARLRRLISARPLALREMAVVHEADNDCCRLEPWLVTHARLAAAVSADGDRMLGVLL